MTVNININGGRVTASGQNPGASNGSGQTFNATLPIENGKHAYRLGSFSAGQIAGMSILGTIVFVLLVMKAFFSNPVGSTVTTTAAAPVAQTVTIKVDPIKVDVDVKK